MRKYRSKVIKFLSGLLLATVLISQSASVQAEADTNSQASITESQTIKVKVDDKTINFDISPYITNERTMVPVRAPMEALGCAVTWNPIKKQAIIIRGSTIVKFTIGSTSYTVNDQMRQMDTAPEITNGRAAFPIRYAVEAVGGKVAWDADTQTIGIISPVAQKRNGMSPLELINKTEQAEKSANTYQSKEINNSKYRTLIFINGESKNEEENQQEIAEKMVQSDPFISYSSIKKSDGTSEETVNTQNAKYVKSANNEWAKTSDTSDQDLLDNRQIIANGVMNGLVFEEDALIDGKDCWVMSSPLNSQTLKIMQQRFEKSLLRGDTSNKDLQKFIDQEINNFTNSGYIKLWIDKETNLCIHEYMYVSASTCASIQNQQTNKSLEMSFDGEFTLDVQNYNFGAPVHFPDYEK